LRPDEQHAPESAEVAANTIATDSDGVTPRLDPPAQPDDAVSRYLQRQAAARQIAPLPLTFMLLMLTFALFSGAILAQRETGLFNHIFLPFHKIALSGDPVVDLLNRRGMAAASGSVASVKGVAFCDGTSMGNSDRQALNQGLATMRRTGEGNQLFALLVTNQVCVGVQDVSYNGGFAMTRRDNQGSWLGSEIRVDTGLVQTGDAEILAATLVHEATHVARAVSGTACDTTDACTKLANGVTVEEEVAAHAAEARWWIALHGSPGDASTSGYNAGLDDLAAAYQAEPAIFRAHVIDLRSSSREGEGL